MANYTFPDVYIDQQKTTNTAIAQSGSYIGGFIGKAQRGVRNKPVLITSWAEYIETFAQGMTSPFINGAYLAYCVYNFFQNGGSACYVLNAASEAVSASYSLGASSSVEIKAKDEGAWGNNLYVKVTRVGTTYDYKFEVFLAESGEDSNPVLVETFTGWDKNLPALVTSSEYVTLKLTVGSESSAVTLLVNACKESETGYVRLSGGADGTSGSIDKYLNYFDTVEDISMLSLTETGATADNKLLLDYCTRRGDVHAVMGVPSAETTSKEVETSVIPNLIGKGSIYYPWIVLTDPLTSGTLEVPCQGGVQGTIVRTAATMGFAKVPAGVNAVIRGAVGLSTALTKTEAGALNELNVCCLLDKVNCGIVIWGCRSLYEKGRGISSILLETKISRELYDGLQEFIFEPNTPATWGKVSRALSTYMRGYWEEGVFEGSTESSAFRVICDSSVNTETTIAKKQLNAMVAYKEKDWAEFIVIKLSHEMAS